MLGAIARRLARATPEERNAIVLSEAFTEAVEASYAAVGTPVEGTMLTVARAAAEAAAEKAGAGARARDVLSAAAAAAREALERTPDQLEVLRQRRRRRRGRPRDRRPARRRRDRAHRTTAPAVARARAAAPPVPVTHGDGRRPHRGRARPTR